MNCIKEFPYALSSKVKGDSWLKWVLTLGSGSTSVWKEKIKTWKHLENSDSTDFFFLEKIFNHFDVRKFGGYFTVYMFEGWRLGEVS